ncbi:ABC transporter substrate-binding protein [Desulfohalobiaceae bacterium Ax17]|uniref:ABC transporter substrate-binding protein n=1 Tax=Desulfovulcanus ferrireducens TaxID=2831190 RepID=UPI00207BA41A|nr:ABC transporter substrate-binding protein [Desulfovulcanus ferrireducens]MBT8764238.1 ABC transporter substrate-binding protein [Desulfovulcanus ferrireducens]
MKILKIFYLTLTICMAVTVNGFAEDVIKLGAIFSASGPASFLGEPEKNTALMLQEQINSQGGILGKKVELIIYDDETDVNKCVLAADKLLKKDRVVAVIGPTTSGNTLAIVNKFERARIPLVSCAAAEKIVKPVKKWVFKTPQSDRHAVTKILKHAKSKGYKKIAIITVSNGFGQAGRAVLKELVPAMGLQLVADEVYGPKDTDMTSQLIKIKGQNPDAIICWGTNPGPAVVARNRVQLGIKTPLYMSHGVASKKFIELAGKASEGIMLPAGRLIVADQISDDNPQKPVLKAYIQDYESKFHTPVSTFGGHAWDAFHLIVKAIEMGNSTKPADIRNNLEKITGFVGTGGIFNFSPADHNGLDEDAFEMVEIQNGEWKIIK